MDFLIYIWESNAASVVLTLPSVVSAPTFSINNIICCINNVKSTNHYAFFHPRLFKIKSNKSRACFTRNISCFYVFLNRLILCFLWMCSQVTLTGYIHSSSCIYRVTTHRFKARSLCFLFNFILFFTQKSQYIVFLTHFWLKICIFHRFFTCFKR